jgi:hypothetical protein
MEKLTVEDIADMVAGHMAHGGAFSVRTLRQLFTFDQIDAFAAALKKLEKEGRICRFYDRTGVILYKATGI